MITYADLIAAFPEFGAVSIYPQPQVEFWLAQAYTQLNADRFGASLGLAAMLFAAHNLALSAQAARAGSRGGGSLSVLSSKSVGGVSASYDTNLAATAGAGAWNATSYGQRLYTMIRAFGAGPVYRLPAAYVWRRGYR